MALIPASAAVLEGEPMNMQSIPWPKTTVIRSEAALDQAIKAIERAIQTIDAFLEQADEDTESANERGVR
jgi:hypothetical protein